MQDSGLANEEPWRSAQSIAEHLLDAGHETYFVGGCVRDRLLGLPVHDVDIATAASPEQAEAVFKHAGLRTIAVGKAFGVINVLSQTGEQVEVASFRSDGAYIDGRRPTTVTSSDARTDVHRRDFTINALLMDPRDGHLIDHVGGQEDLRAKRLRTVGEPADRLAEDRLRVLRALRFAAHLDLTIEPATWTALCQTTLHGLSAERLMQEWDKALGGRDPGRWLILLGSSGRLAEFCPPLWGLDLDLTAERLRRCPSNIAVRCAVFLAAAPLANVRTWLAAQPLASERIKKILWLLECEPERLAKGPASQRWRALRRGWPQDLASFTACCVPDHPRLSELADWAADPRSARTWKPLLTAGDLLNLGFTPGPALGQALSLLEDQELDGIITDRAEALRQAARLCPRLG